MKLKSQTVKVPTRGFKAIELRPEELEGGTVRFSASSETHSYLRTVCDDNGRWIDVPEVLLHRAEHCKMDNAHSLLFNHDPDQVIGRLVDKYLDEDERRAYGVADFDSDEESQKIKAKIERGSVRGISIGYQVHKYLFVDDGEEFKGVKGPALCATDWEIFEMSATPIPADTSVGVGKSQGESDKEVPIEFSGNARTGARPPSTGVHTMKKWKLKDGRELTLAEIIKEVRAGKTLESECGEKFSAEDLGVKTKGAELKALLKARMEDEEEKADDEDEEKEYDDEEEKMEDEEPKKARRNRSSKSVDVTADVLSNLAAYAKAFNVEASKCMDLFIKTKSLKGVRIELEKLEDEKPQHKGRIASSIGEDAREKGYKCMAASVRFRAGERLDEKERDLARNGYSGLSLKEMARQSLVIAGSVTPDEAMRMPIDDVLRACFGKRDRSYAAQGFDSRGFKAGPFNHSTSDFANILADVINKSLQTAYFETPATYQQWVRTVPFSDFKDRYVNQLSEAPDLLQVLENGAIEEGALSERKEQYGIDTFARILSITRRTIINDDLDAFSRIPRMMGNAARRKINRLVYDILKSGELTTGRYAMSDGNALFDATNHSNFANGSAALASATYNAGRVAMRNQTGLLAANDSGESVVLNLEPKYMIIGPTLEYTARQILQSESDLSDNKNAGVINPLRNTATLIVEAELENGTNSSTTAWYLAADNNQIDTVELGLLNGVDAPAIEEEEGFDVLGMRFRVFMDAGAKAIDWRGVYKADND